jgi:hypothetical protein
MTMKNRGVFFKELPIGNIKDGTRRPIEVMRNRMLAMEPFGFDIRSWTPIYPYLKQAAGSGIHYRSRFCSTHVSFSSPWSFGWVQVQCRPESTDVTCSLQVSPLSPSERRVAAPHQERDIWQEERHPRDGIRTERPGDSDRGFIIVANGAYFFLLPVDNHRNDSSGNCDGRSPC